MYKLPASLQRDLLTYDIETADRERWKARQRVISEWIESGALTWQPGYVPNVDGWSMREELCCRWRFPCIECDQEHRFFMAGYQPLVVSNACDFTCSPEPPYWTFNSADFLRLANGRWCQRYKALHCYFNYEDKLSLPALMGKIPPELRDFIENRKMLKGEETMPVSNHSSSSFL